MQTIDDNYYFGKGKKSLLMREADLNLLLLEMAMKINELIERIEQQSLAKTSR